MSASSISALLALTLSAPAGLAQPLSLQHRALAPDEAEADTAVVETAEVEAAPAEAETPDPNAEIDAAQSQRRADASANNWEAEGDALSAKGERAAAIAAYTEALARAESAEQAQSLRSKIDATYAQPAGELPGTEAVEAPPASSSPPAAEGPAAPVAATADADVQGEPITKRWYFWVTVVAITASAGAITGIAAKAAIDERKATRSDLAPGVGAAPAMGPALFRF